MPSPSELNARGEAAVQAAFRDIDALAYRRGPYLNKRKARDFLERPILMENVQRGLSVASSASLIAWGDHILEMYRGKPIAGFGFGGEYRLTEARALRIVGRWFRRFEIAPLVPEYAAEARRDAMMGAM